MSEKLNTAEPPRQGMSRNSIIALIVVVMVVVSVIVGVIFFNLGKNDAGGATPAATGQTTAPGDEGTGQDQGQDGGQDTGQRQDQGEGQVGQGADMTAPELTPAAKAAIEGQWRLDENDPLAVGDLNADQLVQLYFDYQCGYCAKAAVELEPQLAPLVEDGTIRIEYHNLPVLGEESMLAAQGALAAANQGKFPDYHTYIFQRKYNDDPVPLTQEGLTAVAEEIGVADIDQFVADLNSPDIASKLQADQVHATQTLGIRGTPAFIIGYTYVPGLVPYDTFMDVLSAEQARPAA